MISPPKTRRNRAIFWMGCALAGVALATIAPCRAALAQGTGNQDPLKAQFRAIILEFLQLKRDVLKTEGKSPEEILALVRAEAIKKYLAAIDKKIPADDKTVLTDIEKTGVESLVNEVLGEQQPKAPIAEPVKPDGVPPPPEPANPQTYPQAISERIAPDFAIIARAVKNEDANLRGEAGITADARKSRLLQYALGLFARAADIAGADPSKLTDAEKTQAARLADDVIAGKPIIALKAPDSRLTNDELKTLLDAVISKNRQLILAGSDPKSLNHRDQLIEFAKTQVAKDAPGELKPAEVSEIDNLVDQVRFNAISLPTTGVAPTTKPGRATLTQAIRDRLIGLARAVNHGLNALGLDPATRRKILVKFVLEHAATLLGLGPLEMLAPALLPEAEAIVDRIINDVAPINPVVGSPTNTPTTIMNPINYPTTILTQPTVDTGLFPRNLFWFPGCRRKLMYMPMN